MRRMARTGLDLRERIAWVVIAGGFLLFLVFTGKILSTGSDTAVMLVIGIVGIVVISFRPMAGMYVCYALLLIVPVTDMRMNVPLFRSPLQAIAFITIAAALLRFPGADRRLPRSKIYLPLAVVVALFAMFVLVQHGDTPGKRFYDFLAGMWPLPLILLLVDTARKARNVLLGLCAAGVGLTILWLPGLLALSASRSGQLGEQIRTGRALIGFENNPGAVSLLGVFGSLSVQTLVALALIAPVLLGIIFSTRGWRIIALFGFITISLTVFTATIASAVVTLAVGSLSMMVFYAVPNARPDPGKVRAIINGILLIFLAAVIGLSLPPGQRAVERIFNPRNDVSGEIRLVSLEQGWYAFLERPLIGHGPADYDRFTPGGYVLKGHNTFGVMAYEYGLVLLIPFLWLLVAIGRELWRLLRSATSSPQAGVAAGFLAAFAAACVTGFATPTFAQVFQDTVLWTFVGLAIVWNNWKRQDPEAELFPTQLRRATRSSAPPVPTIVGSEVTAVGNGRR